MITIIVIITATIAAYLYTKSENNFFHPYGDNTEKNSEFLEKARTDLIFYLNLKDHNLLYRDRCLTSFDFFLKNPKEFDGATFVRDLHDLKYDTPNVGLPIATMNHDYDHIHGANRNFIKHWKSNYVYVKELLGNGKAFHIERFIGLCLISIIHVPISYIKYKIKK